MAIYHLSHKAINKASGLKATAHYGYLLREDKSQQWYQDHGHGPLAHGESGNMPPWATADARAFWKAADQHERANGRLYLESEVALPVELSSPDKIQLAREFAQQEANLDGHQLPYTFAVHDIDGKNPHVHIMLSERINDGHHRSPELWFKRATPGKDPNTVGAVKESALQHPDWLRDHRRRWAELQNQHLAERNIGVRVDHRSYVAQGIALEPGRHIGRLRNERDNRDFVASRTVELDAIEQRNGQAIIDNPTVLLDALSKQRAVFDGRDIARAVHRHAASEQFDQAHRAVMSSPELVPLGTDAGGLELYTTATTLEREQQLLADAKALELRKNHLVSNKTAKAIAAKSTMSAAQLQAFRHVLAGGDIAIIEGRAGVGKSYTLGQIKQAYEASGFRVQGAALAGKAAEGLAAEGIESRTVHAFAHAWERERDLLTERDVLIVDEAAMLSGTAGQANLQMVVEHAHRNGAKVILCGDSEQLQAIEGAGAFRGLAARLGAAQLDEIRRQREGWQQDATHAFATRKPEHALRAYDEHGFVKEHDDREGAIEHMADKWAVDSGLGKSCIVLAYYRRDVRDLNLACRERWRAAGHIEGRDVELTVSHRVGEGWQSQKRRFAEGDRLYFLKNDRSLDVKNGSLGTVMEVSAKRMRVQLDGPPGSEGGRVVEFDPRRYRNLDHGYGATVYKSQGVTVDRTMAFVSCSESGRTHWDRHATYVAASRHREEFELHYSRDQFADKKQLFGALGRAGNKHMACDVIEGLDVAPTAEFSREFDAKRDLQAPYVEVGEAQWERHPSVQVERHEREHGREQVGGVDAPPSSRRAHKDEVVVLSRQELELAMARAQQREQQPPRQQGQRRAQRVEQEQAQKREAARQARDALTARYEQASRQARGDLLTVDGELQRARLELQKKHVWSRQETARVSAQTWCEYERRHPARAKLGGGKSLRDAARRDAAELAKMQRKIEVTLAKPELLAKTHRRVAKHNAPIIEAQAHIRDPKNREAYALAKAEQRQERMPERIEKAKERQQERDKGKGWGFER